ncbi:hypothetical protein HHE014_06370 [Helicobacter heilmannii]|nr:hypothetical protein HHE014_06370 [Helicobacter heilmannii]
MGCDKRGVNMFFIHNSLTSKAKFKIAPLQEYCDGQHRHQSYDAKGVPTFLSKDARFTLIKHLPLYRVKSQLALLIFKPLYVIVFR